MANIKTFDDISETINGEGGVHVLSVSMEQLRDAQEVGRLGKHILKDIEVSLRRRGLSWYPKLSTNQSDVVRVFRRGTRAEKVIQAITDLDRKDKMNKNEEKDQMLNELFNNTESDIINEIRKLICD